VLARVQLADALADLCIGPVHCELTRHANRYFREKVLGHPWTRMFKVWEPAPPKEAIRAAFERAA
jgi:hypothetical protein